MNFSYKSYPQMVFLAVIHRMNFHFTRFFDHFLNNLRDSFVKQFFAFEKVRTAIIYIYTFKYIDIFFVTTYNICVI